MTLTRDLVDYLIVIVVEYEFPHFQVCGDVLERNTVQWIRKLTCQILSRTIADQFVNIADVAAVNLKFSF